MVRTRLELACHQPSSHQKCAMARSKSRPTPFSINDLDLLSRISGHLKMHASRAFDDEHGRKLEEVLILWKVAFADPEVHPTYAENLISELPFPTSTHLRTLIRAGLIEEDPNPVWHDGRRKPLRATSEGQMLVKHLTTTWNQVAKRAFAGADSDSVQKLSDALRELLELPGQLGRTYREDQ